MHTSGTVTSTIENVQTEEGANATGISPSLNVFVMSYRKLSVDNYAKLGWKHFFIYFLPSC